MGRRKSKLELIGSEKERMTMFKKRATGLMKKMRELTTLCDVNGCLIIHGPNQPRPEIWPQRLEDVNRVIDIYKANKQGGGFCKTTSGLSDFFQEQRKHVEEEFKNLRNKNMEANYPVPTDFLNGLTETQLMELATALENKSPHVKSRIQFLRRRNDALRLDSIDRNYDCNSIPIVFNEAAVAGQGFLNSGFQLTHVNPNFCLNFPIGIESMNMNINPPVIQNPNLGNLHHPQQQLDHYYSANQLNNTGNSMVQPNLMRMSGGNNFTFLENQSFPMAGTGSGMISHTQESTLEYGYHQHSAPPPLTCYRQLPADQDNFLLTEEELRSIVSWLNV